MTDQAQMSDVPARLREEEAWRRATDRANSEFARRGFRLAEAGYSDAYHEARMIFAKAWNGRGDLASRAAPMLVVSAANAARNLAASGRAAQGAGELISAAEIFTKALASQRAEPALKDACAEHLPRLLAELAAFGAKDRASTRNLNEAIDRARLAALKRWKQAAH